MSTTVQTVGLFVFVSAIIYATGDNNTTLHRNKRYVLFPRGGGFKLVLGLAIPVKLGSKQSMACGWNFQFQYGHPQNITQLQSYPPIISTRNRQKRDQIRSDRALAYLAIEGIMNRQGINGRSCLLRSICENAMDSLHHESNGLYGQLLHIALTPDYGGDLDPNLDSVYMDAERAGHFGVDCLSLYPECQYGHGILDMITQFENAVHSI